MTSDSDSGSSPGQPEESPSDGDDAVAVIESRLRKIRINPPEDLEGWRNEVLAVLNSERVLRRVRARTNKLRQAIILDAELRQAASMVGSELTPDQWASAVKLLTSPKGAIAGQASKRRMNLRSITVGLVLGVVGLVIYPFLPPSTTANPLDWILIAFLLVGFILLGITAWYGARHDDESLGKQWTARWWRFWLWFWTIRFGMAALIVAILSIFAVTEPGKVTWQTVMVVALVALLAGLTISGLDLIQDPSMLGDADYEYTNGAAFLKAGRPYSETINLLFEFTRNIAIRERRASRWWLGIFIVLAALATLSAGGAGVVSVGQNAASTSTPSQAAAATETPPAPTTTQVAPSTPPSTGATVTATTTTTTTVLAPDAGSLPGSAPANSSSGDSNSSIVPFLALIGAAAVGLSTALNPGHGWKAADQRAKDIEALSREIQVMHDHDLKDYEPEPEKRKAVEYVLNRLNEISAATPGQVTYWADRNRPQHRG